LFLLIHATIVFENVENDKTTTKLEVTGTDHFISRFMIIMYK